MTSKFKALTENIQPLSSAESTEEKAPPSKLSANSDNTPTCTLTLKTPSELTSPPEKSGPEIPEKNRQHAILLKVLLSSLESSGLIRRFKVLSKDGKWMETQIVFDSRIWDENLELQVLSGMTTVKK